MDRRMHWGNLVLNAAENGKNVVHLRRIEMYGHWSRKGAFRVAGSALYPQPQCRLIALGRVDEEARKLGRLAKRERQEPRGEGIEGAGVAGLGCRERALATRQRLGRRIALGLVEQQDAVGRDPHAPQPSFLRVLGLRTGAGGGGGLTAASMSADKRTPLSTDSSKAKWSSGTLRVVRRRASS